MNPYTMLEILSALLVLLTTVFYSYQVIYLILPLIRKPKPCADASPKRYAILIAARNEENVLPHLLDSIAAQNYPAAAITTYVVADNAPTAPRKLLRPTAPGSSSGSTLKRLARATH